jgi:hypothetical protein
MAVRPAWAMRPNKAAGEAEAVRVRTSRGAGEGVADQRGRRYTLADLDADAAPAAQA